MGQAEPQCWNYIGVWEFDGGPSVSFVRHPTAYVAEHVENDLSIFRFINIPLHTFLDLLVFIVQFQGGVADQIK